MTTDSVYQRLRTHLSYLGLSRTAEVLASHLEEAQHERSSQTVFLERLLAEEVAATEVRRLAGRLRFAHFPVEKRLEDFDFDAQPGLDRHMLEELSTLGFVEEKANLLLIGRPGVGKTHIALGLGHRAVEAGYRVYYTTAADLAARCRRAALEGRWATTMRFLAGPQLLIVDELGYLPMPGDAASAFFQVVARRYEHGSIALTTNRNISSWSEIFEDSVVAVAILDRLLHHATVLAGLAALEIAKVYPRVTVDGFDSDDTSIARARKSAAEAGLEGRVNFEVRDMSDPAVHDGYDLITIFEAIHDMSRPVEVLRQAKGLLRDRGTLLVADENAGESFAEPGPVDGFFYGVSVLYCLPQALSEQPSAAIGTVIRPSTMRALARDAGFSRVEDVPIENDFWRFYRLVP